MNKIMNILMVAIVFAAVSCDYNNKNFPGYNDSNIPKDIKTLEYTMTDDDYKTVANNSTNKGLAKADGKEAELKEIETQKAFNAIITAEKYAPALVASKFPTLDEGSAVRLTYNYKNVANTPLYIDTCRTQAGTISTKTTTTQLILPLPIRRTSSLWHKQIAI